MEQNIADSAAVNLFTINNLWMMMATALVFIMHLGFAALEAGLTQSKNTVNILFKNSVIPALGLITYTVVGFSIMYPGEAFAGSFFGFAGFGVAPGELGLTKDYNVGYTYWTDFLFQGMFAATAATIVSGAVAERVKLSSFLIFSLIFVGVVYPVVGMWKWGGGFLDSLGFYDFAGSTLVHSVGGWGALTGVLLLGPRVGKYRKNRIYPIPGHSLPLAAIGVFLLWLGWFGFNGGSVLSADPGLVSLVLVTTSLSASAGAIGAMVTSWQFLKKPDITMVLNGILAGLVGITAGADLMNPLEAIIIGFVSGVIVVFAVIFFDKVKLDDPVGALSVHLVYGIFGTLVVGVLGDKAGLGQLWSQFTGVAVIGVFVTIISFLLWYSLKKSMGIRVTADEEHEGLDFSEHAMEAYPEFEKVR
ncbi:MAG: ammonium transporter [Melioribacteraceae bacterium]|nr:MAG: ammonium transporter [Melioribacteraceae bacterium]